MDALWEQGPELVPHQPWACGHRGRFHTGLCYLLCLQENHHLSVSPKGQWRGLGLRFQFPLTLQSG